MVVGGGRPTFVHVVGLLGWGCVVVDRFFPSQDFKNFLGRAMGLSGLDIRRNFYAVRSQGAVGTQGVNRGWSSIG